MRPVRWRSVVAGFVGAAVVLAGLLWLADPGAVLSALSRADPRGTGLLFGFACVWLFAWGLTLRTVLGALDVELSVGRSGIVYTAVVFANNITPFGFAGGEAVSALIISNVTGTQYETGFAGIATVDVLNAVSSFGLVLLGVGVYVSSFALVPGIQSLIGTVVVVAVVVTVAFVLAWRYRTRLVDRIASAVAGIAARVGGGLFGSVPVTRADVSTRLHGFIDHIEDINQDRRTLALALALSTSGWVLQGGALAAAFAAMNQDVSFVVLLFAIPLANLAGLTPLPGGLGAIEAAFVGLLVPTTGIDTPTVIASVLLFRAAIYWMPVLVGGVFTAVQGQKTLR